MTAPHGVIASVVTMDTGLGVAECPWVVQAPPGQHINFTLHDFGRARGTSEVCHAYAILRETSPEQRLTVCNGRERRRHVYTSLSNTVEIRILGSNKGRHFLLEYQSKRFQIQYMINTMKLEQNSRYFANGNFKLIFNTMLENRLEFHWRLSLEDRLIVRQHCWFAWFCSCKWN